MLAAQARAAGCEAITLPIEPDDLQRIAGAIRGAIASCDLMIIVAGSSAGRDDYTAQSWFSSTRLSSLCTASPCDPVTPSCWAPSTRLRSSVPRLPRVSVADLRHLRRPAPRRPRGRNRRTAAPDAGPAGAQGRLRDRLRRLGPGPPRRVGRGLVASPLPRGAGVLTSLVRADGLLVIPTEVEGHHAGEEIDIFSFAQPPRDRGHDRGHRLSPPILDLAASELRTRDPRVTLASSNVGSLGGLIALRDGLCHLAGSHLLEPKTGEYTIPYVEQMLGGRDIAIVRLVHREAGLIVAPAIRWPDGIADLARPAVRQPPARAGTRVLLDYELQRAGIDPGRSAATSERNRLTWPSPPPSRPTEPTAAWGCAPRLGLSAWTSCRSQRSPTTS